MELTSRPPLDEPFATALDDAVAFLDRLPEEVIGIWLAGSLARGPGDANSDLDLYVLVDGSHRRRINRRFNGVPVEIFLNPPEWARRYIGENRELGRKSSIGMMASGLILLDPRGECAALADECRAAIDLGPAVPAVQLEFRRYFAVDGLDNARDVADRDPTTARLMAAESLREAATIWFLRQGEWPPRQKELFPVLRARHPEAAALVDRCAATGDLTAGAGALYLLLGVDTFYEWETQPEPM
jgi:hypothetical protein